MKPLASGRIRCCVPGCGRTFKHEGETEVICGKHWRSADKWRRAILTQLRRKYQRHGLSDREAWLFDRLWDKCRAQAIERSFGL